MTKRFPEVLLLLAFAVCWLPVAGFFEALALWKMVFPGLADGEAWLTYGRVQAVAGSALIYGWGCCAGFGTGMWLIARLGGAPVAALRWVRVAAVFWNVGVLVGILGILAGDSRSIEMLEFPAYATPILLVASLIMGVWALVAWGASAYVSGRYAIAGFLGFAWLFSTANVLLLWHPVAGPAQIPIGAWYCGGVLTLWFMPMGLAWIYYAIPETLGRTIHEHSVAILGFWFLVVLGGWTGMSRLVGGPVPVWMVSAGVAAGVMMLIPVAAVAANGFGSLKGRFREMWGNRVMRFVIFGAACFVVAGLEGVLLAIPSISAHARFTSVVSGNYHLLLLGFFMMTMSGAIYRVVPDLTGREWPSAALIRWHFRLAAANVAALVLTIGVFPWIAGLAALGLLLAHGIFAFHFGWMLRRQ